MVLRNSQKTILEYVKNNQPCRAIDIIANAKIRHSAVYNFLKTDYFIKSEKIKGGCGSPKGGGFYYLYSVNKARKDPVVCDRIRPMRITHHPIMQAFYSL